MNIYKPHLKFQNCISTMISGEIFPYYAEFNLFINYIKDSTLKTCGVNITTSGMNLYWNNDFINLLNQKQVNYIVLHETFHLLFNHVERSVGYKTDISNIAQDMIINKIILDDIINTKNNLIKDFVEEPKINNEILSIYPPSEYKGNMVFEDLYKWLINEKIKYENKQSISQYLSNIFDKLDDNNGEFLDKHLSDKITKEHRNQIIENIKTNLKNRGLISSEIEKILNKLKKSEKNYLKNINRSIINCLFGNIKTKTILRSNRKNIEGIKGFKKLSKSINCILDTSGSMFSDIDKILSIIFQNNIKINLIQIDTNIKKIDIIKNKGQLKRIKIKGGGGTVLTPSLKFISKNKKLNKLNNLILTDGMTDILNFEGIKNNTLILTNKINPKFINNKSKVKIIKINNI